MCHEVVTKQKWASVSVGIATGLASSVVLPCPESTNATAFEWDLVLRPKFLKTLVLKKREKAKEISDLSEL